MASEDSGDLSAQHGDAPASSTDDWNGAAAAAENQTSHTENSDQHVQEHILSIDQTPDSPGDTSNDDDDGGEYDPESVTVISTAPAPVVERPVTDFLRPAKKLRTAGGFVVNSSDEEDDDVPSPAPAYPSNTLNPPSEARTRPHGHSPLQQVVNPPPPSDLPLAQASNEPTPAPAPVSDLIPVPATSTDNIAATTNATRSRLPNDVIGILEDRISEDPRGDLEAWMSLIDEQKERHNFDDARAVYERFLKVFPHAAEIWVKYLDMELSLDNSSEAESIFTRTLRSIPKVQLWTSYLNYVRRRNDLNDPTGRARQTVSQSYDFVLNTIGQDREAGSIWQDYIQFIRTGPGQVGGTGWQDQQKMDLLRKAYQRAVSIPMANLNSLWKEYDQFEMGLNKMTGRKFLQERSPSYMTARSANTHLENITRGIERTTLPRLPPAPGFEGEQEYLEQVRLWKAWIHWEISDPLVLKSDDPATYRQRVLHVYKQALMPLRFWPEMWVDAAEWCFDENVTGPEGQDSGLEFLKDGIEANPESALLGLKLSDRIESTQAVREDDVNKAALVQSIRAPCDQVLETLYSMIKRLKDREAAAIVKIEEHSASDIAATGNVDADEEDEGEIKERSSAELAKKAKIKAVQDGFAVEIQMLSQHISYLWIALARIYRRLQGQGHGKGSPPVGMRGLFIEARQRGRLTSDVYLEIAHMEWDIYRDDVATKIFERGAKLFPEKEYFIVKYLEHLHAKRDFTNARVVFSQTVKRFREKFELIPKLRPIYAYFHGYEARFGELAQVKELEKQMTELFPEDPSLAHFAARFSTDTFNPVAARVVVSPARQMRPKTIMQSVEQLSDSGRSSPRPAPHAERSPLPQFAPAINSPKRPFQQDDQDEYPPRKLARGVSPLKGAAGRRLDQQRRAQQGQGTSFHTTAPSPIPRDITFLLGVIPPSDAFPRHQFSTDAMVRLIQNTTVPNFSEWRAQRDGSSRNNLASAHVHTRHASSEYPAYQYSNRDSPGPSGRPASPFGGMNRGVTQASAPYRNSPLRPDSSGSYEPPPAMYQAAGMSQFNPLAQALTPGNPGNSGFPGWQGGGYAPPAQYNPNPNQQHPQHYGGYY
ncbi:hypothetical protein GGR54DRAFT_223338 [Hypoxylon sp. NC1633]|nr:hypothetical protein GGR54DRAFT_223338 [Hypoxylon sp. NC1633]